MSTHWVYLGPFRIELKAGARIMSAPSGTMTYTRVLRGNEIERVVYVTGGVRLNAAGPEYRSGVKKGYPFYWAPRFVRCVIARNGLLLWHEPIPSAGRVCRRCGGSGSLLRPQPDQFLTFKRCSDCSGKGVSGMVRQRTLEDLLAQMRAEGRAFGARARQEANRAAMPEPVVEGSTGLSDEHVRCSMETERLLVMARLRMSQPLSWQQFLDRKQEEINVWQR